MSRKLLTLAALAAALALTVPAANAKDAVSGFGDDAEAFFADAARDIADAADEVEDGAKDTFYFFKDKLDGDDDDIGFRAP